MDLKNAIVVCLISLFSATLVVLIAQALDLHAASRIEPHLAQIVEELQAIRKQGGISRVPGATSGERSPDDGLVVYYFHGNTRCPKCRAIESQSQETVYTDFSAQLDSGQMTWKILNYEDPSVADLKEQFELIVPVVVLARVAGGQVQDWKRLDGVWGLVEDEAAFAEYVRDEINQMLDALREESDVAPDDEATGTSVKENDLSEIPIPDVSTGNPQ
jgi:hypothetical protein